MIQSVAYPYAGALLARPPAQADEPLDRQELRLARRIHAEMRVESRLARLVGVFDMLVMPVIAGFTNRTGTYADNMERRYRATARFVHVMLSHGPDSPEGEAVIAGINEKHQALGIPCRLAEFEFVLYIMTHKCCQVAGRFGGRPMRRREQLAWFRLWRRVGQKMGATGIPADYDLFVQRNQALEQKWLQRPSRIGRRVARNVVSTAADHFPRFLRPIVHQGLYALLEPELAALLDLPRAHPLTRRFLVLGVRVTKLGWSVWRRFGARETSRRDQRSYVANTVNRRVVRVKLAYAAEETCSAP